MGRERKNKVESLLRQIIIHLLLLQYWEAEYERCHRYWAAEIVGFRTQINDRMITNFKNYLIEQLPKIYQDALRYVKTKSGLNCFPNQCP